MYHPIISNNARQRESFLNSFGGLNRQEYAKDNEFADMNNLSSDKFPYISVRKGREREDNLINSNGIVSDNGEYAAYCNPGNDRCVVRFNKANLTFTKEKGLEADLSYIEDLTIRSQLKDEIIGLTGKTVNAKTRYYRPLDSVPYEENDIVRNVIEMSDTDINLELFFKVGDRISISGPRKFFDNSLTDWEDISTVNNENLLEVPKWYITSCTILKIDGHSMDLDCRDKDGDETPLIWYANNTFREFENVTIKKLVPQITDACVLNNRIFGVTESGNYIYACKLGDCTRWYSYEGISTDSWYGQVGTDGEFTGIVEFNGSVIAFKRDYIYKIYGDTPKNFTIQKQSSDGCIDRKSIVELNGRLYFLTQNGFCVYSGGYPTIISEVLNKRYINAVGGTDGRKIYFFATADDGAIELLAYDTVLNMWHLEHWVKGAVPISCFFRYKGELYCIHSNDLIYKINGSGYANSWNFKTQEYNTMGMNYTKLSEVIIYATSGDKKIDCTMNLYILYDGAEESEKVACGSFTLEPNITQRIPIKINPCFSYRLMADGTGPIIIKGIEQTYTGGGKNEGNRR